MEGSLRERLLDLDHRVEWGRRVDDLLPDADGVSVTFGDDEQQRCGWVVGCDGAHSAVRKRAGIAFPGVPLIERFLLADVSATLPIPRESVSVWLRGQDLLAAFPLPGADRWRLMATAPDTMTAPRRSQGWSQRCPSGCTRGPDGRRVRSVRSTGPRRS